MFVKKLLKNLKREPRILLIGYYGYGNAGDEAMLRVTVEEVKKRMPHSDIRILSGSPEETKLATGLHSYPNPYDYSGSIIRRMVMSRVLLWPNIVIFGGGTMLQNYGKGSGMRGYGLLKYFLTVFLLRLFLKKVYMLGVGIGPFTSPIWEICGCVTVVLCSAITLRDRHSLEILHKYPMIRKKKMMLAQDMGLLFKPNIMVDLPKTNIIKIGISLRPIAPLYAKSEKYEEELFLKIIHAITLVKGKMGLLELHFIPMQKDFDNEVHVIFANQLEDPEMYFLIHSPSNVDETVSLIQNMDIVLTMRLHALVFSVASLVPAIALSYHPKVTQFARAAHCNYFPLPTFPDPHTLSQAIEESLSRGVDKKLIAILKKDAEINFEPINNLIGLN